MVLTRARASLPLEIYRAQIAAIPVLGPVEERELAQRVARGDPEARDQLVRAHLRLVVFRARSYVGHGLPLEDLISEGNLGLLCAVERYNLRFGTRFQSYADYWIRQSILCAIHRDRGVIRLPHHMRGLLVKWLRAAHALRGELDRPPTDEEVAHRLGLGPRGTRSVRKALGARALGQEPDGSDEGALEMVAQADGSDPAESLDEPERRRIVENLLEKLSEREAAIIRGRFGLDGRAEETLQEVGRHLGCTREWVRRVEKGALDKLRTHLSV